MLVSIAFLVYWAKAKFSKYRKRNKWGYNSINNSDTLSAMKQAQLPATPSATKGNWIQIYHIFAIIGCIIRIITFIMCFLDDDSSSDGSNITFDKNNGSVINKNDSKLHVNWDLAFSFVGSYCFVLCFLIVLCCLAEVYHSAGETEMQQRVRFIQSLQIRSGMSSRRWDDPSEGAINRIRRITTGIIIFTLFLIAATFLIGFFCGDDLKDLKNQLLYTLPQFIAILFYAAFIIGFIVYGVLIFRQTRSLLQSFKLKSNENLKRSIHNAYVALFRIIFMIIISVLCFIFRISVICIQIYGVFKEDNPDLSLTLWCVDLLYYTFLEWLPLVTTLIIFIIIPSTEKKYDDITIVPIASY